MVGFGNFRFELDNVQDIADILDSWVCDSLDDKYLY